MATPTPTDPSDTADSGASLVQRLQAHRKVLTGAGIAMALVVVVGWVMVESGRRREAAATAMLEGGWSLQDQGNLPQASAEFQRVVDAFGGTDAAMRATLALNQVRLESDQAQIAADALRAFIDRGPPAEYRSSANRMLGAALETLGSHAEAAAAYEAAASEAALGPFKAEALLAAARAHRAAGQGERAMVALRRILADHDETAVASEARVRLAELTRGAM